MPRTFVFRKELDGPDQAWGLINHLALQGIEGDFELALDGKTLTVRLDDHYRQLVEDYFSAPQARRSVDLFCDGGARGNPGPGACGFVLLGGEGQVLLEGGQFFKHCTNNYAEYQGLRLGLEAALKAGVEHLNVFMDSQLIVRQMNKQYKVRSKDLLPLHNAIKDDLARLKSYKISFIPRQHNKQADAMVNKILDQHT